MDLHLKGRTALVTGASQGIGEGVAAALAAEGCNLVLAARSEERLAAVKQRIEAASRVTVAVHSIDLAEHGAPERAYALANSPDIVVNNAGAIPAGSLTDIGEAKWREAWELKLFGYINLTRAAYAGMKARGAGVIVNVLGAAGESPDFGYIAGTTANAGLMAFTRALGGRSLDDGIRVVGVNPGPVDTDRIRTLLRARAKAKYGDESRYEEFLQGFPMKRAAQVREIADLVAFLASDRSSYTSGTIVTVDGGLANRRG